MTANCLTDTPIEVLNWAELIQTLYDDLTAAKKARLDKLHEQLAQAEALPDSEKARALQDRLKARIRDTENRASLPMTVDQLRLLKASKLVKFRRDGKTVFYSLDDDHVRSMIALGMEHVEE